MESHSAGMARFNWKAQLYALLTASFLFASIEVVFQWDISFFLSLFVIALLFVSSIVLLIFAAISKNHRRPCLQQLRTLAIFLIVALAILAFERSHPFAIRDAARWLVSSPDYKAQVLAQPQPPNGELKHIGWDVWGFPGAGDTTVYLVFDPTDSLSAGARSDQSGKFKGIPCEVPSIRRLESGWYTVLFYTDQTWGNCN